MRKVLVMAVALLVMVLGTALIFRAHAQGEFQLKAWEGQTVSVRVSGAEMYKGVTLKSATNQGVLIEVEGRMAYVPLNWVMVVQKER